MGEEIADENGRISDFQGLVTLTLTLDRVILHTVMHHSSTYTLPTYQILFNSKKLFVDGRTDGRADGRTDVRTGGRTLILRLTLLGRLGGDDLKLIQHEKG